MNEKTILKTPDGLQNLCLTAQDGVLVGVSFTDESPTEVPFCLRDAARWFDGYFSSGEPAFMPEYRITGVSPFCERVLSLLRKIPYGKTTTYGELAKKYCIKYGVKRMSAQAIGGAVGRNPLVILLPCHRVIGADGVLMGYAYGISNKKELLRREGFL